MTGTIVWEYQNPVNEFEPTLYLKNEYLIKKTASRELKIRDNSLKAENHTRCIIVTLDLILFFKRAFTQPS